MCVFCKIINKEIPANIVYEDDYVLAFNDVNPVSSVHVLVVPKKHIKNLNDVDELDMEYIIKLHYAFKKIAEKLDVKERGYRVISNCGKGAGQTVFHLHYHLISGSRLTEKIM